MKLPLPDSIRALRSALVCILLAGVISNAAAVSFTGTGGGLIPDNSPAAGVNTNFAVSGLTGQVNTVTISVEITHTWVGDVKATLIAPSGIAQLRLFGRVGRGVADTNGDSSNLGAVYTFDDNAGLNLWTTMAGLDTLGVAPAGTYRTSTGGAAARSDMGGCSSFLNLAFGGLTAAQANGTWTLLVSDSASTDTGTVNAAGSTLNITTGPVVETGPLFASGFETGEVLTIVNPGPVIASNTRGTCTPVVNSPTDSGLTDFVVVRAAAPPAITWKIKTNDGGAIGPVLPDITLGIDTDFFQMGDFDGDGISDLMVYRPGTNGTFFIRRSSRPNDVPLAIRLGAIGDEPDVSADFDGDHVTDAAVYRDGSPGNTTAHFYIRLSSTGIIRDIPVINTDGGIAFALKDVSGDGLADVAIQRNGGGGVGHFQFFNGSTGALVGAEFDFEMSSDFVMSGQYSGNALTDIIASRNVNPGSGTVKTFFPRDSGTGIAGAQFVNGIPGDFICPGDYDGDGILDIALWRSSPTPDTSKFIVRKSSNVAAPLDVLFGANGDYPVNNWDVH